MIGLGVCGSGRQIAGLHALTDGVINEIIAHATAAVYFDPEVDTIFEIGGQDAKYTYITNGVPSDYAMNEACSAGTGSFLEESAFETLGVRTEDIADIALRGQRPPNFNDQCAAFIASDIKNAIHEGVAHENIVAGLVYSICMNYTNRVKGNRPVGEKVFMQGGVCYNRAVPLAMAALVGKPIVVPPEPGLMGAFGVALEVKQRIGSGLMDEGSFDLLALAERKVEYGKTFTCPGGKEKCDRRCDISMVAVDGQKFPFGGACNRYYNLRRQIRVDTAKLDLVRARNRIIFDPAHTAAQAADHRPRKRVGINRSFLVNTYYPLYSTFFSELGFEVTLPDAPTRAGIDRRNAPFCYPAELAHGFFHRLLAADDPPEFIFLPHFKAVPADGGQTRSEVCPLVQGETFYLQTTFQDEIRQLRRRGSRVLAPLLDMTAGMAAVKKPMVETAMAMGAGKKAAERAFETAARRQESGMAAMQAAGRKALDELAEDPERMAVVLFGRPYSAFVEEAHMGIPRKLASRGVMVIPVDFLPLGDEKSKRHMYWGMGQLILKAARAVARHPQLFGTYITNFSCGPDSFVIGYFREIMGEKPSLTLELDSHTADAGLETRIEAFLDVVSAYRKLSAVRPAAAALPPFRPARTTLDNGAPGVVTSAGERVPMADPKVTVLFPSMGRLSTEFITALFKGAGFHAVALPPADEAVLKLGRANTSCKECLPLILTTGSLLGYINNGKRPDEILVYFMATGSGPCRFGQYAIFMEDLIRRLRIPDVTLFSLSSENSYAGLDRNFQKKGWWGVVTADHDGRHPVHAPGQCEGPGRGHGGVRGPVAEDPVGDRAPGQPRGRGFPPSGTAAGPHRGAAVPPAHEAPRRDGAQDLPRGGNIRAQGRAVPTEHHRAAGGKRLCHGVLPGGRVDELHRLAGGQTLDGRKTDPGRETGHQIQAALQGQVRKPHPPGSGALRARPQQPGGRVRRRPHRRPVRFPPPLRGGHFDGGLRPRGDRVPHLRRHRHRSVRVHAQPHVRVHSDRGHAQGRQAGRGPGRPEARRRAPGHGRQPAVSGHRKRRLSLSPAHQRQAGGILPARRASAPADDDVVGKRGIVGRLPDKLTSPCQVPILSMTYRGRGP